MPLTNCGGRQENDDSIVFMLVVFVKKEEGKGEEMVPVGRRKAACLPPVTLEGETSAERTPLPEPSYTKQVGCHPRTVPGWFLFLC